MSYDNESIVAKIQSGDKNLLEELWLNNQGIIIDICKKYTGDRFPHDTDKDGKPIGVNPDLKQESFLCLMDCVYSYDVDGGCSFVSFFVRRLEWHLYGYMKSQGLVRVPEWLRQLKNKYDSYINNYYMEHGSYPNDSAVMDALDISNKALQAVKGINLSIRSLDVPVGGSDADLMLWDIIPDDAAAVDDCVMDAVRLEELRQVWDICKDNTTQREYEALSLRYMENQTIQQTADSMGVSVQRVNNLNEVSLSKLRRCPKLRELAGVNDDDLPEKVYFCGGYRNFKNNKDTSLVERIAVKNADKRRRKRKPKQEDIKALEQELISIFGNVPDVI